MQVFRDYRLIECETTMRCLTPVAIREVAVFNTEDVALVVHAYWRDHYGHYVPVDDSGYPIGECLCSACGDYLTASDEYYVRGFYCPNCGAKMDGDPHAEIDSII